MGTGRGDQKARTRKAILEAAARLLEQGSRPGFDEIAAQAGVSRATAYRYFPGLDGLLSEAAVHAMVPEPEEVLGPDGPTDVSERLLAVDDVFDRASRSREIPLRLMLARMLERSTLAPEGERSLLRQNRRTPMIERALEPLQDQIDDETRDRLVASLAMIVGTEGLIALSDVVGLEPEQARRVRHWAICALLRAAIEGGC